MSVSFVLYGCFIQVQAVDIQRCSIVLKESGDMAVRVTSGKKTIPGIVEPPLFGSMFTFSRDRLALTLRVARECGDIGQYHFGPYALIQMNSPELAHSVLVERAYDFDKGALTHNAFEPMIGQGLFISEGDFHRRQRKLMAPSFQPHQIKSYADAMVHYGEQIQQHWREGATINLGEEMTALTMSIVGKVLFDAEVFKETDELGAAMADLLAFTNYGISNLFPIPLSWPVPRSNRARRSLAILDKQIYKMIHDRQQSSDERNDFLSILLNAREEDGSPMSPKQVRDEAITLFGAGHETTASALTWAWYLLAGHPEILQKLQAEVDTVLQGRVPTFTDLPNLPYTLQILKEAMRLYPPAYAVARVALHDLEIDGYHVAKGQSVLVAVYAIHHRPDFYPEPEVFRPERFTPEQEKKLPRYAYMPFGAGPRVCIGNHFAQMEGHLLLATLAQHVSLELVSGQQIKPDLTNTITIRPNHPVQMIVRRRDEKRA